MWSKLKGANSKICYRVLIKYGKTYIMIRMKANEFISYFIDSSMHNNYKLDRQTII